MRSALARPVRADHAIDLTGVTDGPAPQTGVRQAGAAVIISEMRCLATDGFRITGTRRSSENEKAILGGWPL